VSAVWAVFTVILLVVTAIGISSLQAWLERWDRDRHFEE
jgi:hypothetical protein